MTVEEINFTTSTGRSLSGRLYASGADGDTGIIFSYGLFANKDGYKITRLAPDLAASGYRVLAFDFSYATGSGGDISDLSLLQEVEDLSAAIAFARGRGFRNIHLMGSSMGAAVTLLYASRGDDSIRSLILIATPVDIRTLLIDGAGIADAGSLPEDGTTAIDGIPIKNAFFREIGRIDMEEAVSKIRVPVLAFHGGRDSVVDPENAELLEEYLETYVKTVVIDDGDHNLTRDMDIRLMKESITEWLAGDGDGE
jgi:pimeloyl-ACP methyl ester carboxylesterase